MAFCTILVGTGSFDVIFCVLYDGREEDILEPVYKYQVYTPNSDTTNQVGKDAEFRYFLFDQCCIRRLRLTSSSDSMQKAAALSILCHALLDKKMEYCRVHTVLAAKQLLHAKAVVDECAERLVVLDELLRDLYDNEHDVSEEIGAMLDEQAQEEATHQALTAAVRAHRALLQRLVHKKTRLETCRKGILHRQRRLVERAFRMQVAENSAELLAQSI